MTYTPDYINDHLLFPMPARCSDVGILMGARSISGLIAREAATLYREGRYPYLIVTGGLKIRQPSALLAFYWAGQGRATKGFSRDFLTSALESDYMRDVLVKEGVPEDRIVCHENRSRNTGENVQNILKFLDESTPRIQSATLVVMAPLQRRAMGTIRKYYRPNQIKLTTHAVYPFGITRDNWHEHGFFRRVLQGEAAKLNPKIRGNYLSAGFCQAVDVSQEIANWGAVHSAPPTRAEISAPAQTR